MGKEKGHVKGENKQTRRRKRSTRKRMKRRKWERKINLGNEEEIRKEKPPNTKGALYML